MDGRDYSEIKQIIQETVNGKIDDIKSILTDHIDHDREWKEDIEEQLGEMDIKLTKLKPVSDSLTFINIGKKFLTWLGLPVLVALAWLYTKLK